MRASAWLPWARSAARCALSAAASCEGVVSVCSQVMVVVDPDVLHGLRLGVAGGRVVRLNGVADLQASDRALTTRRGDSGVGAEAHGTARCTLWGCAIYLYWRLLARTGVSAYIAGALAGRPLDGGDVA